MKTFCANAVATVHIYTDGSCKHPHNVTSRFATYCVVIDWCQNDAERITEANKYLETRKLPLTLQVVGYARCTGEQSIARAELLAITKCYEELQNITVHSDSRFALHCVDLAKNSSNPWDWKDNAQFDLVERLSKVSHDDKQTSKIKAHQVPHEIGHPLMRYHALGNMLADEGANSALVNVAKEVAVEQHQRHTDLETQRADVSDLYKLVLDLQYARAQYEDTETTGEQGEEESTPQLTLQEAIGRWSPDSEWRLQDIDRQWLVNSAWGYSIAESVIQWFQHCRWPCNNEGPSGKKMGISWTEICLAISLAHGGWMPGRRGKGKEERLVHFSNPAEAIAHGSNLAEQTINTWKIVTHIQSLTPQRLWPSMVKQGKVSSLFLLGNPIFTTGFSWRPAFAQQELVANILTEWFKQFGNIHRLMGFRTCLLNGKLIFLLQIAICHLLGVQETRRHKML